MIVESGADVNKQNPEWYSNTISSPICGAIRSWNMSMVELPVQHGVDSDQLDDDDDSQVPLVLAVECEKAERL